MAEYVLCETRDKVGGAIYTIHAGGYRCHVGKTLQTVQAPDIDGAVNQFSANFFDYPTFAECGCIAARARVKRTAK